MSVSASILDGKTQQFVAKAVYSDGSQKDVTGLATWSSKNTAVATINGASLATGVGAGSTTIEATYQNLSGSATLNVTDSSTDVVEIFRAEYIVKRQQLRVFATSSAAPNAVLEAYDATGTHCYGKLNYAGGNYYVLSRPKVQDPGGSVIVRSSFKGSDQKPVVYR